MAYRYQLTNPISLQNLLKNVDEFCENVCSKHFIRVAIYLHFKNFMKLMIDLEMSILDFIYIRP